MAPLVLVTGGSGLVGKGIRWQVRDDGFDGVCSRRLHDAFPVPSRSFACCSATACCSLTVSTRQVEENGNTPQGATFVFLSSKDADLRNLESTRACFQKVFLLRFPVFTWQPM